MEKEGVILKKNDKEAGYFLLEVMFAAFLLFSICLTIFPLLYQLKIENQKLLERMIVTQKLYDSVVLFDKSISYSTTYSNWISADVVLNYEKAAPYWKGCARWQNVKSETETICLYTD
ncbi:hypothetical protein [Gracilibacillus oryzae]|uniref:hypothetical protein n=1 Tax=Gracilibacillus oryzae TaxID=1672701 RepID=UPI001D18152D|nr:hypothetical protein [Gracilibacillus oryzae]